MMIRKLAAVGCAALILAMGAYAQTGDAEKKSANPAPSPKTAAPAAKNAEPTPPKAAAKPSKAAPALPKSAPVPRENTPLHPKGSDDPMGDLLSGMKEQDIRELIETVRMVRLSQELNLSDEQTILLVRKFRDLKAKTEELRKQRQALQQQLKNLIKDDGKDAVLEGKLKQLMQLDRKIANLKLDAFEGASSKLNPSQRARLYVFLGEFEGHLRKMVERARQQGFRPGPGEGARRPGWTPRGDRSGQGTPARPVRPRETAPKEAPKE